MKSTDMQLHFENKFRTLDKTGARKYFQTYQIEQFLNQAYDDYMFSLIDEFEVNEKARKALSRYTIRVELEELAFPTDFVKLDESSKLFGFSSTEDDILNNIIVVVEEHVRSTNGLVDVKPVTHDYYFANINNKYKRPYDKLVWRLDVGIDTALDNGHRFQSVHELVSRNIDYDKYFITYIRKYLPIMIDKDTIVYLPDKDCKNIADLAVSYAAKSIGLTQADNTAAE
jgi:hypothetical protein